VLLTGALVAAILAATVGGFFSCRLAAHEAAAASRGGAFARSGVWVVRAAHRYYLLAVAPATGREVIFSPTARFH
jgi:hypothetical protein